MAPWTMTEAAKLLGVPSHRLIHLCERKVVVPDLQEARGRGSSRQFSTRNIFDFAVALEMRRLELPVSYVQAVLRVLRAFESEAKTLLDEFVLPESLLVSDAPRLSLIILDGDQLYLSLARGGEPPRVFGGVNIRHPRARGRARQHRSVGRLEPEQADKALHGARTRTEIDLSQIAQHLGDRLRGA